MFLLSSSKVLKDSITDTFCSHGERRYRYLMNGKETTSVIYAWKFSKDVHWMTIEILHSSNEH